MNKEKMRKKHGEVVDMIDDYMVYIHFEVDIPMYTACLLFGEGGTILSRGVSICSLRDGFNHREGRNRAMGRAIKALTNAGNFDPIKVENRPADDYIQKLRKTRVSNEKIRKHIKLATFLPVFVAGDSFSFKSEYSPTLTAHEMELLQVIADE